MQHLIDLTMYLKKSLFLSIDMSIVSQFYSSQYKMVFLIQNNLLFFCNFHKKISKASKKDSTSEKIPKVLTCFQNKMIGHVLTNII